MTRMRSVRSAALPAIFSAISPGLLATALLALGAAAPAAEVHLDRWPSERANDPAALQHGARLFVTNCLNCHSARLMRWNKL